MKLKSNVLPLDDWRFRHKMFQAWWTFALLTLWTYPYKVVLTNEAYEVDVTHKLPLGHYNEADYLEFYFYMRRKMMQKQILCFIFAHEWMAINRQLWCTHKAKGFYDSLWKGFFFWLWGDFRHRSCRMFMQHFCSFCELWCHRRAKVVPVDRHKSQCLEGN